MVSSQIKLHAKFGGVVPNLAKREHQRNLPIVLLKALREGKLLKMSKRLDKLTVYPKPVEGKLLDSIFTHEPELLKKFKKDVVKISAPDVDAIAVTYGPGLAPALWVGVNFAKALAYVWNKPLIPVNHMEGHIYSAFQQPVKFPALALLVSGGHTELVLVNNFGKYKIIGETLDDAVGEAFDKVARLLKLGYPGGPAIAAEAAKRQVTSDKLQVIKLPRPMLNSGDLNFSFSGLKTAVLYLIRDLEKQKINIKKLHPAIAKEFQDAAVEVLVKKTIAAAKKYKVKSVLLGGGVSANKLLREKLEQGVSEALHVTCHMSHVTLSGDNALMIALAAFFAGKKKSPDKIRAEANLRL